MKLLKWTLLQLCEVPENDPVQADPARNVTAGTQCDNDPIVKSLARINCKRFFRDLLTMSGQEILNLKEEVTDSTSSKTSLELIPIHKQRMLHAAVAFYHHVMFNKKGQAVFVKQSKKDIDDFRIHFYDKDTDVIVSWRRRIANQMSYELEMWQKALKPSSKDYPVFREASKWQFVKESFETTAQNHGTLLQISPDYVVPPSEIQMDEKKHGFMYKVLQDTMKVGYAQVTVAKYLDTKDTRKIWKDIYEYSKTSMGNSIQCRKLSTYLTGQRFETSNWKGLVTEYISYWTKTMRTYNETSPEKFSDFRQCEMLNIALQGESMGALSQVLNSANTARTAAGNSTPIDFNTYYQMVLNAAATFDESKGSSRRGRSSINMTELVFDNGHGMDYELNVHDAYESNVHNMDTPIKALMGNKSTEVHMRDRNTAGKPQRVFMNTGTWKKLSKPGRTAWLSMPEDDKELILKEEKPSENTSSRGTQAKSRFANAHESSGDAGTAVNQDSPDANVEAGTRDRQPTFLGERVSSKTGAGPLLDIAKSHGVADSGELAMVPSKNPKRAPKQKASVGVHEIVCSSSTPYEFMSHERVFNDNVLRENTQESSPLDAVIMNVDNPPADPDTLSAILLVDRRLKIHSGYINRLFTTLLTLLIPLTVFSWDLHHRNRQVQPLCPLHPNFMIPLVLPRPVHLPQILCLAQVHWS